MIEETKLREIRTVQARACHHGLDVFGEDGRGPTSLLVHHHSGKKPRFRYWQPLELQWGYVCTH
jgi:hypothetical protein